MKEYICLECSIIYTSKHKNTKYCSKKCSGKARSGLKCLEEFTCLECGIKFKAKRSQKRKYCSVECSSLARTKKPKSGKEVPCEQCGNVFYIELWQIEYGRKYCSKKCYGRWQSERDPEYYKTMRKHRRVWFPLAEETKRKISKALAGRKNPGMRARALAQVGEKHPRWAGPRLHKRRGREEAVKLFKEKPCGRCGSEEYIHRHHVDENTHNNSPENIEFLCASCHTKEHWQRRHLCR